MWCEPIVKVVVGEDKNPQKNDFWKVNKHDRVTISRLIVFFFCPNKFLSASASPKTSMIRSSFCCLDKKKEKLLRTATSYAESQKRKREISLTW